MPVSLRTRIAPSPTGALHLGNARTFVVNWLLAKQRNWQIVLRIDDLDGPRVRAEADRQAIELLEWLGLTWDEGPVYQTARRQRYHTALENLARDGSIYPCRCTRREIEAASRSAPHNDQGELCYPGTCRIRRAQVPPFRAQHDVAWRLRAPTRPVTFTDSFCGEHTFSIGTTVGDFLVATKGGEASYQLAVTTDDADQQISDVVRGDDLLSSTPRQHWIAERLGLKIPQRYFHLPLVVGADGRRLAKRHGDTKLVRYQSAGTSPQRILGLLAEWCGLGRRRSMDLDELLERFDVRQLPTMPIVYSIGDDQWLLDRNRAAEH